MKAIQKIAVLFFLCFLSIALFAINTTTTLGKEAQAKHWFKNQPLAFVENKGQFITTEGKPADNVLFKTKYGNCDIYITTEGLTYVFAKYEEEKELKIKNERLKTSTEHSKSIEKGLKLGDSEKEENNKVSYYRLDMKLIGANIDRANIIKEHSGQQGHCNYFYPHCPDGIYGVEEYSKLCIKNIYKGIDWVIYSNSNNKEQPLKYDFIVHPQASYKAIKICFLNAQAISLSASKTKLQIQTIAGKIEEGDLFSYQFNKDKKEEVKSNYVINNDSIIEFELSNYDTTKTLVIDPLVWATYYGGSLDDELNSICVDGQDNIFITGHTQSLDFPTQQFAGAFWQATNLSGNQDIILVKFNRYGQRLWSTYYGGTYWDWANSICADSQDNIYITGKTNSNNFPTQYLATAYWQGAYSEVDAYILKFNSQGQRLWATYYGGNDWDEALSICLDSQDNLYITGITVNSYLPTQQLAGAFWQAANADGDEDIFILKFNSQGQRLWATYYGGSDWDYGCSICTDYQDNIYITGYTHSSNFPTKELSGAYWQATNSGDHDIFILKFNSQGVRQWATYYGGANIDCAYSICSDSYNNIYVTGRTNSTDFPIQQLSGAYNQCSLAGNGFPYFNDLFILKFNMQGQRLWASYYGGNYDEMARSIVADNHDNVYITGSTESFNFPTQYLTGAYNQLSNIGLYEAFMLKFNSQGVRQWATYYTSYYGADIVADHQNAVYFIGRASDYPDIFTKDYGNAAYYDNSSNGSDDAFILKFIFCNVQMPVTAICNRNHFCQNDNGNITLTASGGEGDILKWYTGSCGQTLIGNGLSLTIPSPIQTTTYYARWESCDTSFSDCVSITVNVDTATTVKPEVAFCNRNNFCANDTGSIMLTAKGGRGNALKWFTGKCGETYIGSDTLTILSPVINTTYYVRWENSCDTSACTSVKVDVKSLPLVSLGSDGFICEGDSIAINENSGFSSYLWQDGSTNPNFVVSHAGLYWLRVNEDGCYNSDTILYSLCEPPLNIWVPTAFTPNGDGRNDVFKIETINTIKDFHMYIFNRWGQQVFETKDIVEGWDGNSMGKEATSGIYVWKITYTWEGNYKEYRNGEQQGKLLLLR